MKLNQSQVDILMPVYNGERYLRETLDSALAQNYRDYTVTVVDDGSIDSTPQILSFYKGSHGSIFNWTRQSNSGEAKAVNLAFEMTNAPYVTVLNADDKIEPELLTAAVEILDAHPEVVVVYPDWVRIDGNSRPIERIDTPDYRLDILLGDLRCIPGPGAVFRRSAVAQGPLRDTTYRYVGDFECWLRLSLQGTFYRLPQYLASWRDHSEGATALSGSLGIATELRVASEVFALRTDLPESHRQLLRQSKAMSLYFLSLAKFQHNELGATRLMLESLFTRFSRNKPVHTRRKILLVSVILLPAPVGKFIRRLKACLPNSI